MTKRGFLIGAIVLVLLLTVALGAVLFVVILPKGKSTATPASATIGVATRTRTAAQAGPTETPAPTDTPSPTSTPAKGIRAASGITETQGLAASVPTRVANTPTVPKPTATLKPGETRQPEGQKIEVPNPLGGDPFSVPIPGGYTVMPTVNIQLPQLGGPTPTATPKPCTNWGGIGCPSVPKSDQPASKPVSGDNQEGGGFPFLPVCGGGFVILIVVAIVVFRHFGGSISIQNNTP